jgi:flagellar basal-body rod protein FlgF
MDRLAFNAMSTINEERLIRQQLTNDLANVSTVGFKRTFEANIQPELAVGFGFDTRMQPRLVTTDRVNLEPGPLMVTGRDLDVAMNHKTVLGVTGSDGKLAFTRRGDLKVNSNGVLETGSGHIVLLPCRKVSRFLLVPRALCMPTTQRSKAFPCSRQLPS